MIGDIENDAHLRGGGVEHERLETYLPTEKGSLVMTVVMVHPQ